MTFKPKIQNTLIVLFSVILAATIYLGFVASRNNKRFKKSVVRLQRTEEILVSVHKISSLSKDLQLSSSAYILSGKPDFLRMYRESKAGIIRNIEAIRPLLANEPAQRYQLEMLKKYVDSLIIFADQSLVRDRLNFRVENDFLGIQQRGYLQRHVNIQVTELIRTERKLLSNIETVNAANIETSNRTFIALSMLVLLLLVKSFLAVVYHLKKRRQAEEALRESEEGFRSILDSVKDYAIFRIDKTGNIVNWNLGAQYIKGYTFREIVGKPISIFYPQQENPEGFAQRLLQQAKEHGKFETEGWQVRKDGSRFWANVLITAIYDDKGEILGFTKVTRDDTLRKKAEEEIRNSLEREKELSEMKSNFISIASHEFKTPLSIILTSAALIARYRTPDLEERRNRELKRIISSTKNMNTIIDEFLSLQKIEEGKATTRKEMFNLKDFTANICGQLKGLTKPGQEILHTHEGCEIVCCDPTILRQILTNLVSNAIKYSPENASVNITTRAIDGQLQICVKDQGIGISEEDQKHLFERFFRASNARGVKGTGLGLHITKRYAELLQGTIKVETALGKGSEFIVEIQGE